MVPGAALPRRPIAPLSGRTDGSPSARYIPVACLLSQTPDEQDVSRAAVRSLNLEYAIQKLMPPDLTPPKRSRRSLECQHTFASSPEHHGAPGPFPIAAC